MRNSNEDKKSEEKKSLAKHNVVDVLDDVGFNLISEWTEAIKSKDMKKAITLSKMFPFVLPKVPKYGFSTSTTNVITEITKVIDDEEAALEAVMTYPETADISVDQNRLRCAFRCSECKLYLIDGTNTEDDSDGQMCPSCFRFFSTDEAESAEAKTKSAFIKAWLEKQPTKK